MLSLSFSPIGRMCLKHALNVTRSKKRQTCAKAKQRNKSSMEPETYLIDLFFRVCQQVGEVCEHFTIKNNLRLLISPCHNVPHRPQSRRLPFEDVQLKKH